MKMVVYSALFASLLALASSSIAAEEEKGWVSLFDGKTYGQWKPSENPDSWSIQDGAIVAHGPRSHLFYMGDDFTNFEFKADVMTTKGSNSGIYFHTKFQPGGWPTQGYETQVNNTHGDPVKTGSIYNTVKLFKSEAEDDKWWTQHIIVQGKRVIVKIDGKKVIDYTEPDDKKGPVKLSKGTFAFQAHDPKSVAKYKNIMVKPLP